MASARCFATIPGPKPRPLLGNSWRFAIGQKPWRTRNLDITLWNLRDIAGGGGAAKVSRLFGHPDLVFPFCAEETAKIYRREDAMPHRAVAPCLRHYKQELRKDFFGNEPGLIGVHGMPWSKFRSKVSKALVAPEAARAAVPSLEGVAIDFLDRMESILDENSELPNDFLMELYKWALESVGAWALGTRLGCFKDNDVDAKEIIKNIHGFFHSVPTLELSAPLWRLYSTTAYKKYINALDSFRSLCLKRLTDKGVCAEIAKVCGEKVATILALDLLLVGVDTTAAAAASTTYLLAKNTRAQKRLQKELDEYLPVGRTLTSKDLDRLPYLKASIKEALRIKPVILGNGRSIQSDAIISGYKVPKGSHVVFPHYIMSNEERYFPSPNEYIPERWLRDNGDVNEEESTTQLAKDRDRAMQICGKANGSICEHAAAMSVWSRQREIGIHPFASLPFGFGRRMCIGKRFAEAELQLLLAKVRAIQIRGKANGSICEHAAALSVWSRQREIGIHPFASLPFGFGRRMCIGKRFAEAELQLLLAKVRAIQIRGKANGSICEHAAAVWSRQREIGIHPFASLPFGFGRRMCIGKRFAEAELQLLLAKIFYKYNVSWNYGELTYSVTPTYVPNEPLKFTLHPRK